jgi:hypothetical protein
LGVLLYELLTGITPFAKERLKEASYDEICHIIREEEPARPSTRLSTLGQAAISVSANRKSEPKGLSRLRMWRDGQYGYFIPSGTVAPEYPIRSWCLALGVSLKHLAVRIVGILHGPEFVGLQARMPWVSCQWIDRFLDLLEPSFFRTGLLSPLGLTRGMDG